MDLATIEHGEALCNLHSRVKWYPDDNIRKIERFTNIRDHIVNSRLLIVTENVGSVRPRRGGSTCDVTWTWRLVLISHPSIPNLNSTLYLQGVLLWKVPHSCFISSTPYTGTVVLSVSHALIVPEYRYAIFLCGFYIPFYKTSKSVRIFSVNRKLTNSIWWREKFKNRLT